MKKLALILSMCLCFSSLVACGDKNDNDGSGEMFDIALYKNPSSLDPQSATDISSITVISNMFSGLLTLDANGILINDNAESYTICDDGLTYEFKLNENNYWFVDLDKDDYADDDEFYKVTAKDYVFAFQRLFDPNTQAPLASNFACIKNAEKIMKNELLPTAVGVEAKGDDTVIFHLDYANADFLKLLTTTPAMPCNEEFFYNTKGRYGLDEDSVISNGAFFMRQWFYDPYGSHNILYMRRNSVNSEYDKVYPSYLNFKIESDMNTINSDFIAGNLDCIDTLSFNKKYDSKKYGYQSYSSITLGIIFNENSEIFSNNNIKKALAYSIDRNSAKAKIDDDVKMAYGIIPPAITLLGRSYRELYSDELFSRYDEESAVKHFETAKAELNKETFGSTKILVCTNTVNSDQVHTITQQWSEKLGFYIGVEEVDTNSFYERLESGDYDLALYPITADYNSGTSLLSNFAKNINTSDNIKESIFKLNRIESSSDYVDEFSRIEQLILDELSFIPVFYKNVYLTFRIENEDIQYDPFSKAVIFQYAKNYE